MAHARTVFTALIPASVFEGFSANRPSTVIGRLVLCVAFSLLMREPLAAQPEQVPSPLTYQAAVDFASSRNLAVAAARRRRAIREANIRTAGQIPNPDLSVEITRDTPHQAVVLGVPVEMNGRRGRRIDLAKEELALADVDVQVELRTLRRDVRLAFYALVAAEDRARLSTDALDIARRLHDAAQSRFEAGAVPRLEVLQADLGVARAEADLERARQLRAAAQATLNGVFSLSPDQPLVVSGDAMVSVAIPTAAAAMTLATAANTDLVALDRQIAIEARRVDLLKAERVPTPVFSVGGVFDAPGEFKAGPRAGVSVELPLFSRNQGEISASVATTAQLRAAREATRRRIESEVYAVIAKAGANRQHVDTFRQRLVPTATELEGLAQESYAAGRTSVLGVLEAQRSLRDLRLEALQAALELQASLAEMEELLGTPLP
jgi:cobalt-zinc-cadmium efflux system outer membrane protein